MSDDDDDPVVEEIPVYLSHSLADHLYVFQYPVVPCTNSGIYNVVKSKIKPENGEVALDLGLDTSSSNFDQGHAEEISSSIDQGSSGQDKLFSKKLMDKIFLESSRVSADCDNFGIGLMHGRELHISPIRSIISMTPSFKHLNVSNEEETGIEAEETNESITPAGAAAPSPKLNPKKGSYKSYLKKLAQESWYSTDYFEPNTPKAEAERVSLCRCECRSGVWLSSEGWGLTTATVGEEVKDKALSISTILSSLSTPLSLSQLSTVLSSSLPSGTVSTSVSGTSIYSSQRISDDDLISKVLPYCIIVSGRFLPRSDLVYPPDSLSRVNGIKGDIMARARDYILYHFNEGNGLNRASLFELIKIPLEEIDEILSSVAIKSDKKWVFKCSPDMDFTNRYIHIIEQQRMLWEARYKQVLESFETGGGTVGGGSSSPRMPRRRRESEGSISGGGGGKGGNKKLQPNPSH